MIREDVIRRLKRFVNGDRRVEDLDRIFLFMRDKSYGRESIRELGDFVAHREQREKGPITKRVQDFFDSSEVWIKTQFGQNPILSELRRSANANLRMASDELIWERLSLRKSAAEKLLNEALLKLERRQLLTARELNIIDYLGASLIWRPAFTANELCSDFEKITVKNKLLDPSVVPLDEKSVTFLTLYAIALMHGSSIRMASGMIAELRGEIDSERRLVVRSTIEYLNMPKPMTSLFCIFFSEQTPNKTCSGELQRSVGPWQSNIELQSDGLLHIVK